MHIQCREWKRCLRVLVRRAQFISTLDLAKEYWQIPMQAPFGLYEFEVMLFGLHIAPATFQYGAPFVPKYST